MRLVVEFAAHVAGEAAAESQAEADAGGGVGRLAGRFAKGSEDSPPLIGRDAGAVVAEPQSVFFR